jgi:hypothetical protein
VSTLFILGLVALTTLAAYAVGRRALRLSPSHLARAAGEALESVGLLILFYLANLAAGAMLGLAARAAGYFVSLYLLTDPAVLALSFLQAMVFQRWRDEE